MKTIAEIKYKKLGHDGYYASIELNKENSDTYELHEFFHEDWKVLCDRVLFFCVDLVSEE